MKAKILLVDDEPVILKQMRCALSPEFTVLTASTAKEAISIYERERPSVVTLDLALDAVDPRDFAGIRLLEQILSRDGSTRAIMLTGHNDDSVALQAMELGAFDYYVKPVRVDELRVMIKRGVHLRQLLHKGRRTSDRTRNRPHRLPGSAGSQGARREVPRIPLPLNSEPTDVNLKLAKKAIELDFIKKALARNAGVVTRAARELGISRVSLYDLIQKHKIRLEEFKMRPVTAREVS